MNKIFVAEPTGRLSLEAILDHPWLKGKTISYVNTPFFPVYFVPVIFSHFPSRPTNHFPLYRRPEAIRADLSRRKTKVEEARRQEKRQKQLAKQKRKGTTFDPDATIYRSVDHSAAAADMPKALPVPAEGVSHFTSFHVKEHAPEILSRIEQSLSKLSAKTTVVPGYKVKSSVTTPVGEISVAIQIYADGDNHIVELRRQRGSTLKFQQLYTSIWDDLADITAIV